MLRVLSSTTAVRCRYSVLISAIRGWVSVARARSSVYAVVRCLERFSATLSHARPRRYLGAPPLTPPRHQSGSEEGRGPRAGRGWLPWSRALPGHVGFFFDGGICVYVGAARAGSRRSGAGLAPRPQALPMPATARSIGLSPFY
jgi:hypothetical protein